MGDFNYPNTCCRYCRIYTGGFGYSRNIFIDDDFLTPMTKEPMRGYALLNLTLKTKEKLVENVKVKGSLGFRHHEK